MTAVLTVALIWRMLAAGFSPRQVAESTGEDLGVILDLQTEMPALKQPDAVAG